MKQKNINMLEGSLWKNIFFFAIPLILIGILEQLFNAADVAVVGRFSGEKGTNAMAAVGASSSIIGLLVSTFIAVSLGCNVIVAQALGAKDYDGVRKCVHTSILTSLLFGIVIFLVGFFLADQIFKTQNIPSEVYDMTIKYFKIYCIGVPFILLYNFLAAIYRGVGNTKTPLIVLLISGILNLVLNLVFVIVFDLDVAGVAISTTISNALSSLILLILLFLSKSFVKVSIKDLKIDINTLKKILHIGIPAGVGSAVFCIANIVIQTKINSLGSTIMAASSAAYNIEAIVSYVFAGFSQAATTFVGQNFGAQNIKRCKKTLYVALIEGLIAMIVADCFIYLFGKQILLLFNTNKEVIKYGYLRLLFICTSYIFTLMYEIFAGYMRGFGISILPSILTIVGICGVRLTWIYTVFPKHKTFKTILTAYPLSLGITALLLFALLIIMRPARKYE